MKHLLFFSLLITSTASFANQKNYLIKSVHAKKNVLIITPGSAFKRDYVHRNFRAEYDSSINLELIPNEILEIPFILSVISAVWQSGQTYWVKKMDSQLATSLEKVREVYRKFYPEISWDGHLKADELVDSSSKNQNDVIGLVFSGGVDSTYTSLMHQNKKQLLITYLGFSEEIGNRSWRHAQLQCRNFAQQFSHRTNFFVKSNFRSLLKLGTLQHKHRTIFSWRESCQEALSLAGLAAPILYIQGCKEFIISSSWDWGFPYAWGSHPFIDNNLEFAGVCVKNYDYFTSRQNKIRHINELCKNLTIDPPMYHVCRGGKNGGNCTLCEKCMRTMNGLVVEEASLDAYGFATTYDLVYERTHKQFDDKVTFPRFSHAVCHIWNDIQSRAQERLDNNEITNPDLKNYLEWLCSLDFEKYINSNQFKRKINFEELMYFLPDHQA